MTHCTPKRKARPSLGLLALEPRWMFDGAAATDAANAAPDAAAKAQISDVPAPVVIRGADPSQDNGKKEVVFVDTSAADYKSLEAQVRAGVEIVEFDGSRGGLAQIAKWAENHTGYDSISLLSHGCEATLRAGTDVITTANLQDATVQEELATIGSSLKADGDLLLYGCNIGTGENGQAFLSALSEATGADIAASNDMTGVDGDWVLEVQQGQIDTQDLDITGYDYDLASASATLSIAGVSGSATASASYSSSAGGLSSLASLSHSNFDDVGKSITVTVTGAVAGQQWNVYYDKGPGSGDYPNGVFGTISGTGNGSVTVTGIVDGTATTFKFEIAAQPVPPNTAPTAGSGSLTVTEGGSGSINLATLATDAETASSALTYSGTGVSGTTMSYSATASATLKGTVLAATRTYTVTDAGGLSSTGTVNVYVVYANDPTVWNSSPSNKSWASTGTMSYSWASGASDPDDSVSYTFQSISGGTPSGMSTGTTLSWNPGADVAGRTYTVNVAASGSTTVTKSFTISMGTAAQLNDAPTTSNTSKSLSEDGSLTFAASNFPFSDADSGSLYNTRASVQIVTLPPNGTLRLNGVDVTAGQIIPSSSIGNLVYTPNPNYNGSTSFTFKVSDGLAWSASAATMTLNVSAVNDAPVLTGHGNEMTAITEDDTANSGQTVASIMASVSDVDAGTSKGIAIYGTTINGTAAGKWQYKVGSGSWTDMGTVSTTGALLLKDTDLIRFLPDGGNGQTASFDYYAWDRSSGSAGSKVNVSTRDGTTAFSTAGDSIAISVSDVNDAPTGAVTISGTVAQNQTLSVSNTLADRDGLGTISYQWQAGGVDLAGATGTTLALTEALVGKVITVRANYTDSKGAAETKSSAATVAVANVNDTPTGSVTISGVVREGQTLFASNSLDDVDGMGTVTYQWKADGVNIAGATGNTLQLGQDQVNKVITVQARYTDGHGTVETVLSAATAAVSSGNHAPTGAVTITGTPTQGQTLTANTATLADFEGLGTLSYQWYANGIAIDGATGSTLNLPQTLVGKTIAVRVGYTDGAGTVESATSAATAAVANVNDTPTGTVAISGEAAVGQTLTATNSLADLDGISGTIGYQWYANGTAIVGETGSTLLLAAERAGQLITVQASYTDDYGTAESVTSAATTAVLASSANNAPTGSLIITGTPTLGQSLSAASSIADSDGLGTLTYQWYADGKAIPGATGGTLTLAQAQVGKQITVRASYTDGGGVAESVLSGATTAVANVNSAPTGGVTIAGNPEQRQVLTAVNTLGDADGISSIGYQWQVSDDGTSGWSDLSGQNGGTLTLAQAQVGKYIRVVASYTDGRGTAESAASSATAIIANVNDLPTGGIAITGSATQGQVLGLTDTLADVDGMGTVSYQWQANGADISGATGTTLTLTQALVGKSISVRASYTDQTGVAEAAAATATGAVANVNDTPTGSVAITGSTMRGQTLTASNSLADIDGLGTISYQWYANGVAIAGATGTTLTLDRPQVGKTITVKATYTDGQGTVEQVTSAATATIANLNIPHTGAVTVSGTPTQGQTLTVSNTLADADGLGTISYQWLENGEPIAGATGTTLVLGQAQVGKTISVRASYTDDYFTTESETSAATAAVANINDAPTGGVSISGTPTQGQTLTAANTLADADGLGTISYQWQANGVDIPGATGDTLVLAQSQVGKVISVRAIYTDGYGTAEAVTSAATSAVANVNDAPTADNAIADATWTGSGAKSLQFAANVFSDLDQDTLSYSAQLSNGQPLPSWLSLNPATRTLSGNPPGLADGQTYAITITATDPSGASAATTFNLAIATANDAPALANGIPDQTHNGAGTWTYQVPVNTVTDGDNDSLRWSAKLANGDPLPTWLVFDTVARTFKGNPPAGIGSLNIAVTAADGNGGSVSDTFTLTLTNSNDVPILVNPLGSQVISGPGTWSYTVPADTFTDADGDTLSWSATLADGSALPAWLSFNDATLVLSGNAPNGTPELDLKISVSDGKGGTASSTFRLGIGQGGTNDAPTVANHSSDVTWTGGGSHRTQVSSNTFADADGDRLQVTAQLSDGSALPSWMKFDSSTWTFIGNPPASVNGQSYSIVVTADDGHGGSVTDTFTLSIANANDTPVLANSIQNQDFDGTGNWTYQVPVNAFTDGDGDSLSWSATLADGSALPSWLSFNAATRTFSGNPPAGISQVMLKVTATDPSAASASASFALNLANTNDAPSLANPLGPQHMAGPGAWTYQVPANTFSADPDGDTLTWIATQADGTALPSWLSFDSNTHTFSGNPPAGVPDVALKVTVNDGLGGTATSSFLLSIAQGTTNDIPEVASTINDQRFSGEGSWRFQVPGNTFRDGDGDALTLSASLSDGSALPAWMHFDAATWTFSGNPPASENGKSYVLKVTAADNLQGSVGTTFTLSITNANDTPTVANPVVEQSWNGSGSKNFQFSVNVFSDGDGDAMTYSASLADGTALPSWLGFDAATRTFTGNPPSNLPYVDLKVTAADGNGGTRSLTFRQLITNANDTPVAASPNLGLDLGKGGTVQLPAGAFSDADGDSLVYKAGGANGTSLPGWLTFDPVNRTFAGTPPQGSKGSVLVTITVVDPSGASVFTTVSLSYDNPAPSSAAPVTGKGETNTGSSSKTPGESASDAPKLATVIRTAVSDTAAQFTQGSQSGGVKTAGSTPTINAVREGALFVAKGIPSLITESSVINFSVPADAFGHTVAEAGIQLSAKLVDGRPLPNWVSFDPSRGTFVGEAPEGFRGALVVIVIARDSAGHEVATTFRIQVGAGAVQDAPRTTPEADRAPPQKQPAAATSDRPAPLKDGKAVRNSAHMPGKPSFTHQLRMAARNAAFRLG